MMIDIVGLTIMSEMKSLIGLNKKRTLKHKEPKLKVTVSNMM